MQGEDSKNQGAKDANTLHACPHGPIGPYHRKGCRKHLWEHTIFQIVRAGIKHCPYMPARVFASLNLPISEF